MNHLINDLKNDIVRDQHIYIPGILFVVSEPLAFWSIIIALKHSIGLLSKVNRVFYISKLFMTLFLAIGFWLRIRYMWNKPLARILVICNTIGWTLVTIIYFIIYLKYLKTKKKDIFLNSEET